MSIRGAHILILAGKAEKYDSVVTHLVYKGAQVKIITDVSDAIEYIEQKGPEFVIVSVDHPSSMARKMVSVLKSFPLLVCVPTAEVKNSETTKLLDAIESDHLLRPPLTGLRVENHLDLLYSKIKKKKESLASSIDYNKPIDDTGVLDSGSDSSEAGAEKLTQLDSFKLEIKGNGSQDLNEKVSVSSDKLDLLERAIGFEAGDFLKSEPSSEQVDLGQVGDSSGMELVVPKISNGAQSSHQIDILHVFDNFKNDFNSVRVDPKPEYLKDLNGFLAISLQTPDYPGIVFAAFSKAVDIQSQEVQRILSAFYKNIESFTKVATEPVLIDIQLNKFDFSRWMRKLEGKTQSFVIDDIDITWGYLDSVSPSMDVEDQEGTDYARVKLSDIRPDVELNHDVFLHLPRNNKFILHTREGESFDGDRQSRLQSKSVENLHVKKDDVKKFKHYRLEAEVNQLVSHPEDMSAVSKSSKKAA